MPCFGGPDLQTLFVTTARHGRSAAELAAFPDSGAVFCLRVDIPGLAVQHVFRLMFVDSGMLAQVAHHKVHAHHQIHRGVSCKSQGLGQGGVERGCGIRHGKWRRSLDWRATEHKVSCFTATLYRLCITWRVVPRVASARANPTRPRRVLQDVLCKVDFRRYRLPDFPFKQRELMEKLTNSSSHCVADNRNPYGTRLAWGGKSFHSLGA